MSRSTIVLTGLAAAAALAVAMPAFSAAQAPAPTPAAKPKPERQCFDANTVSGFTPVDDRHVILQVGANRHYELTLMGVCRDIDWTWRLGVRTRAGGSNICTGLDADIIVPDRSFPQRCPVTDIRRLTPEEAKAAQARRR